MTTRTTDDDRAVLTALAHGYPHELTLQEVADVAGLSQLRADFCLDRMKSAELVNEVFTLDDDEPPSYKLTTGGRNYAIAHDLDLDD